MASTVIKNWDNKTWLSSKNYINSFNNFLIKNIRINSKFKILDIGCGRGKILGSLSSKLKLKEKPLGIDIVNHKDRDRKIADSLTELFRTRYNLYSYNKKALYILIRERTGVHTQYITKVVGKLKLIYAELYTEYNKTGHITVMYKLKDSNG